MKSKKINTVNLLILIFALQGIGANLAHPITPAYLKSLDFPSTMFGIVYAAMSFTNFAFSPFWGVMSRYIKTKNLLFIGLVGYAVGQAIFGFNSNPYIIIIGRFVSGAFVSATFVGTAYYAVDKSSDAEKGRNLTKMTSIHSMTGTIGYFLGGYLGKTSLKTPFILQVIILVSTGILYYLFLENNEVEEKIDVNRVIRSSSPLIKSDKPLTKVLFLNFLVVFLISTASTSLTQTFSYFIDDSLNLSSLANGVTKGLVGIISLILNFTISLRIVSSKDIEKNINYLFMLIAGIMIPMLIFKNMALSFMIVGVIAMSFDAMPSSLLQSRTVEYSEKEVQGEMVGYHNTMKSLGMIIGSLIAGWIYEFNVVSPFIMSISLYAISALILVRLRKSI